MAPQVRAALERLRERGEYLEPDDLVFPDPWGRPLAEHVVWRRFEAAREAAKLRHLRFHDLRHCFGSQLATSGYGVEVIAEAMGHGDYEVTKRYLHARPASELAEGFGEAFAA